MDKLLEFIRKSDFYTAPASTRFHGAYEGGLLEHSLNVYDCLDKKTSGSEHNIWKGLLNTDKISNDSIVIVSLLHDPVSYTHLRLKVVYGLHICIWLPFA